MKTLDLEKLKNAGSLPDASTQDGSEPLPYDGPPWPAPLREDAFHGLAGDVVRRIEPHTEADPAALLVTFLLAFGNAAGRNAHWLAESTPHFANEFAVIVGQSAQARKGTSLDRILALFSMADPTWHADNVRSGLSSGEGVIFSMRDPKIDAGGVVLDEGVTDKRLFVAEGEFAQVLTNGARKDNTLSVVLRNGWDGKTLRSMAKNSGKGADTATDPHFSMLGHITHPELKKKLADTDATNGFANRFLWVCARRSKELPLGGDFKIESCIGLTGRLCDAVMCAKTREKIGFTPPAEELWVSIYGELGRSRPGLDSVVDRAPAHVRRLAMIYALLDEADTVDVAHLRAALAVWDYCLASAEFIFGGLSKNARDLYERLRLAYPRELDRTDLLNAYGRHTRAEDLTSALGELARCGLATSRKERTGGAPRELWRAQAN